MRACTAKLRKKILACVAGFFRSTDCMQLAFITANLYYHHSLLSCKVFKNHTIIFKTASQRGLLQHCFHDSQVSYTIVFITARLAAPLFSSQRDFFNSTQKAMQVLTNRSICPNVMSGVNIHKRNCAKTVSHQISRHHEPNQYHNIIIIVVIIFTLSAAARLF
jgi:hypothetical protein